MLSLYWERLWVKHVWPGCGSFVCVGCSASLCLWGQRLAPPHGYAICPMLSADRTNLSEPLL
eukprot:scaffold126551_cov29-Tisochrysis_lutea.AAC.1